MKKVRIGNNFIGNENKPYFIADIASNHDGDIERAYKLIELAKKSGADAAKFQNFLASKIVSRNGFENLKSKLAHQSSWNKSVYEVYEDASIPVKWTEKLKKKCDEFEIEYMSSVYDIESVDIIDPFVNAYKIGSGDITWIEIVEHIADKNKPVFVATGASTINDVLRVMKSLEKSRDKIILMQCNTNYSVNKENFKFINLRVLKSYRDLFPDVLLGLSDHTKGDSTVLGAITLGACVIEKHFTDDNDRTGPDHKFSMTPNLWGEMVKKSFELWEALGDGIKKIEENEKDTAIVQRRGLYFTRNINKGAILKKEDLFPLRPKYEDGIEPYNLYSIVGKRLKKDVIKDEYIKWKDI